MAIYYWGDCYDDNAPWEEDLVAEREYMREHRDSREAFTQSQQDAYDWEYAEFCDKMDGEEYDD